jgi:hypothetical protein
MPFVEGKRDDENIEQSQYQIQGHVDAHRYLHDLENDESKKDQYPERVRPYPSGQKANDDERFHGPVAQEKPGEKGLGIGSDELSNPDDVQNSMLPKPFEALHACETAGQFPQFIQGESEEDAPARQFREGIDPLQQDSE